MARIYDSFLDLVGKTPLLNPHNFNAKNAPDATGRVRQRPDRQENDRDG